MSRLKQFLCFMVVMIFALSFAACGRHDERNRSGGNDETAGDGGTVVELPDVPDTGNVPSNQIPEVDEETLVGSADTTSARAVIILKKETADITGTGATVQTNREYDILDENGVKTGIKTTYGTVVEISESGTYVLQGTLYGFVAVSKKDLNVTLVLNGVNIYCENYAAVVCLKKSDVAVVLAEHATNYLTDGGVGATDGRYHFGYDGEEQPNAALMTRKDLAVSGAGKLIVSGGANNGIASRANLTISDGDITVYAAANALKGNDSVSILGGRFTLVAQNDGIKTENAEEGAGFVDITGGEFVIASVHDGITAATALTIQNAAIKMKTGGGAAVATTADSAKGLKAGTALTIHAGSFELDTNDDALHANDTVVINGGAFAISSADDGIHADTRLTINGGTIDISKAYEGLESYDIDLNGGFVKIKATDDGVNVSGGNDGSANADNRPGTGGNRPGQPGGGMGGQEPIIDGTLTITGGEYYVDASGDGLDSNGKIVMTGGTVVVFGPTSDMNVPIDYDTSFVMTGGYLYAFGYMGNMAQQPGSASTQYTCMVKFSSTVAAGTLLHLSSANEDEIVTISMIKQVRGVVVCSPALEKGTYKVMSGGMHSGTENRLGIYTDGVYTGGNVLKTFTISGIVTTIN